MTFTISWRYHYSDRYACDSSSPAPASSIWPNLDATGSGTLMRYNTLLKSDALEAHGARLARRNVVLEDEV